MAITRIHTNSSDSGAASTTVTVPIPADVEAGDLFLWVGRQYTITTGVAGCVPPTGWQWIGPRARPGPVSNLMHPMFSYIADGTESGNWTFTYASSNSPHWVLAQYRADSGQIRWDYDTGLFSNASAALTQQFPASTSRVAGLPVLMTHVVLTTSIPPDIDPLSADWSEVAESRSTTNYAAIHEAAALVNADSTLPAAGLSAASDTFGVENSGWVYLILTEEIIDTGIANIGRPSYVSTGSADPTFDIPAPLDQEAGDNVLIVLAVRTSTIDITGWPSGFTEIFDEVAGDGTGGRLFIAYGPAGGSTYTISKGSGTQFYAAFAFAIKGDVTITAGNISQVSLNASGTIPAVSSTVQNAQAIWFALAYRNPSTGMFVVSSGESAAGGFVTGVASRTNLRMGYRFRQEPGSFPAISGSATDASNYLLLGQLLLEPTADPDWGSGGGNGGNGSHIKILVPLLLPS